VSWQASAERGFIPGWLRKVSLQIIQKFTEA
jgi:hypothetical protein